MISTLRSYYSIPCRTLDLWFSRFMVAVVTARPRGSTTPLIMLLEAPVVISRAGLTLVVPLVARRRAVNSVPVEALELAIVALTYFRTGSKNVNVVLALVT